MKHIPQEFCKIISYCGLSIRRDRVGDYGDPDICMDCVQEQAILIDFERELVTVPSGNN